MLNVRAILLLWLLVLMSGAALLNASTATARETEEEWLKRASTPLEHLNHAALYALDERVRTKYDLEWRSSLFDDYSVGVSPDNEIKWIDLYGRDVMQALGLREPLDAVNRAITMRQRSDRVEWELVPVKPVTMEDVASSPEYIERVRNRETPMYTPEGADFEENIKKHPGYYSNQDPVYLWSEKILPDFYYEQKRQDDMARGFAALSIGWNNESAEDNKQLRQDAVNAFGERWVADWEKQSPVTQAEIAGKRFLTENYTLPGDTGHEAITRYNDATEEDRKKDGTLIALDEYDVWQHIQKKGKEWYAGEEAKRNAEKKAKKAREEEEARIRSEEEYKKEKLNNTILTVSLSVIGVIVGACPLFLLCKASRRWNYEQWAAALAVVLLGLAVFAAVFPWWLRLPYGFYLFLRVIVAVLAAWQAARALMEKRHPLLFLLPACLCLIYQPLVKIPFERETWLWLNAASVFVLIIGARRKKNDAENDV